MYMIINSSKLFKFFYSPPLLMHMISLSYLRTLNSYSQIILYVNIESLFTGKQFSFHCITLFEFCEFAWCFISILNNFIDMGISCLAFIKQIRKKKKWLYRMLFLSWPAYLSLVTCSWPFRHGNRLQGILRFRRNLFCGVSETAVCWVRQSLIPLIQTQSYLGVHQQFDKNEFKPNRNQHYNLFILEFIW